jgi:phosphate transport system substrate-binding protein
LSWRCKPGSRLSAVLVVCAFASGSYGQVAERLSQVRKLYVGSLGTDKGAPEMRAQLVRRLQKSHDVQVVSDPKHADALLRGTGRLWVTGRVSLSPHSHISSQPIFEGFLSAEVVGKNDETLWSYLVSPSNLHWNGIPDDLARQLVSKLLASIKGEPQPEPSVAGPSAQVEGTLRGAGATFPAPLYQRWFELFQEQYPQVHISYAAVGSAEGILRLKEGKVDFGASEMPLSDAAMAAAHQRFTHVPSVLGAVVVIYNVKGLRQNLNFTPEILSGIFLGKIRRWNDPEIRKSNRGAALPDAPIAVAHRSDGSGTSFVWTDYLSKISPQWKASVGTGATVRWPVGIGADGNEGVASAVQQTPNSIGYVEFIYALQHELSFGAVMNSDGQFIKASISSVTAAAATTGQPGQDFRLSITNAPGKAAYPIATYTWLLLPERVQDKSRKTALTELVRWLLTSGQKKCSELGYAPLPVDVAARALESLDGTK